jgi:hypothetical protein
MAMAGYGKVWLRVISDFMFSSHVASLPLQGVTVIYHDLSLSATLCLSSFASNKIGSECDRFISIISEKVLAHTEVCSARPIAAPACNILQPQAMCPSPLPFIHEA